MITITYAEYEKAFRAIVEKPETLTTASLDLLKELDKDLREKSAFEAAGQQAMRENTAMLTEMGRRFLQQTQSTPDTDASSDEDNNAALAELIKNGWGVDANGS